MPPRQPLKPKSPTGAPARRNVKKPVPLAEALPEISAQLSAARPLTKASRGYSPYPDLTMAIEMLDKRAANLTEGERRVLILKWRETLNKLNDEMQKLHKLELLANRLITPKP